MPLVGRNSPFVENVTMNHLYRVYFRQTFGKREERST